MAVNLSASHLTAICFFTSFQVCEECAYSSAQADTWKCYGGVMAACYKSDKRKHVVFFELHFVSPDL